MGRTLALAGALITALLWLGGLEGAHAARLDPEFGDDGVLPMPAAPPAYRADSIPLPDGRTLWVGAQEMAAFLPSGEIDAAFGHEGVATLRVPANGVAVFGTVLVDPLGRLVVVTTCSFPGEARPSPFGDEDRPSRVLVERFTPDGQPDLSFGERDGMVLTDFGLPSPEPGLLPTLRVWAGAALDARGRILVSGVRGAGVRPRKEIGVRRAEEAFLARLTPDGQVDPSFGSGGGLAMPGFTEAGWLVPDDTGGAFVTYRRGAWRFVARIAPNGDLDPSFGEGGLRAFAPGISPYANPLEPVGVNPGGALVVSGKVQGNRERHVRSGFAVKTLLPSGKLDPSYGRNGVAVLRYPRLVASAERLDERGRVVSAMLLRGRNRSGILMDAPHVGIALARLRADGGLDRGFGRAGVFRVPLPGRGAVRIESFSVAEGAALIGVKRCRRGCESFLVRVLLDR